MDGFLLLGLTLRVRRNDQTRRIFEAAFEQRLAESYLLTYTYYHLVVVLTSAVYA